MQKIGAFFFLLFFVIFNFFCIECIFEDKYLCHSMEKDPATDMFTVERSPEVSSDLILC